MKINVKYNETKDRLVVKFERSRVVRVLDKGTYELLLSSKNKVVGYLIDRYSEFPWLNKRFAQYLGKTAYFQKDIAVLI